MVHFESYTSQSSCRCGQRYTNELRSNGVCCVVRVKYQPKRQKTKAIDHENTELVKEHFFGARPRTLRGRAPTHKLKTNEDELTQT